MSIIAAYIDIYHHLDFYCGLNKKKYRKVRNEAGSKSLTDESLYLLVVDPNGEWLRRVIQVS